MFKSSDRKFIQQAFSHQRRYKEEAMLHGNFSSVFLLDFFGREFGQVLNIKEELH